MIPDATPTPADALPAGEPALAMPDSLLALGWDRLYAARPADAARAFLGACLVAPDDGDAWAALAEARSAAGQADAVSALARALRVDPRRWALRLALAEAQRAAGDAAALDSFATLIAERPDSAAARLGHARALTAAARLDDAIAEYREALALSPGHRDAALDLADVLVGTGDALAAAEMLEPLRRRHPDDAALHAAAGRAWLALAEREKARAALERARDLDPADGCGAAALLATMDANGPAGAEVVLSPAYVRALFDRYADRFDRDLVDRLAYDAPRALRAAADRALPVRRGLDVLDLGCGTGLAGVAFRDMAAHLAGVDLAPRMVAKARARGVYDALAVGDAIAALDAEAARWDLVVAADVLVYIGDLAPLFAAAARALRPGGRFAATVEALDGEGYVLQPTRRFAHAATHVTASAAAAGLEVTTLDPCSPRREKGSPVPGLLFILAMPSA